MKINKVGVVAHSRIHSSYNTDRIAACFINKPHKIRATTVRHYYAQYSGKTVSVQWGNGHIKFELSFEDDIASALCRDGKFSVELVNGDHYTYDLKTGEQISGPVALIKKIAENYVAVEAA